MALHEEAKRSHEWGWWAAAWRGSVEKALMGAGWLDGGRTSLAQYKDRWVKDHRTSIRVLAREYRIPPEVLAGIAWIEVGGDPDDLDALKHVGATLDHVGDGVLFGLDVKDFTPRPEMVSFGDVQIQLRNVARLAGVEGPPDFWQRREIIKLLKDEQYNLGVVAKFVADGLDARYPNRTAETFSREMTLYAGYGYNAGFPAVDGAIRDRTGDGGSALDALESLQSGWRSREGHDLDRHLPRMRDLLGVAP